MRKANLSPELDHFAVFCRVAACGHRLGTISAAGRYWPIGQPSHPAAGVRPPLKIVCPRCGTKQEVPPNPALRR